MRTIVAVLFTLAAITVAAAHSEDDMDQSVRYMSNAKTCNGMRAAPCADRYYGFNPAGIPASRDRLGF